MGRLTLASLVGFEKPRFSAPTPETASDSREGPRKLAFLERFRCTKGKT